LFFFFIIPGLYGADLSITGKELGFEFIPEYNRTFYQAWSFAVLGSVTLNNRHAIRGGLALRETTDLYEADAFINGEAALPFSLPVSVGFTYYYNVLPDYAETIHSALPIVSLKGQWAGISLGLNVRFTVPGTDPLVVESILAFSTYVNFFNTEDLRIGLKWANYNDFTAGNMGSYFLNLNSMIRVIPSLALINELELYQSGSVGLVAVFYGVAYKAGVSFTW
jgi:hypothetical protein